MNWMTKPAPSLHASPLPRCKAVFSRNALTLMRNPRPLHPVAATGPVARRYRLRTTSSPLPVTMGRHLRGFFARCLAVVG
jgi:hypothetical protein